MDKEYSSTTDREVYVNTVETVPTTVTTEDSGTGWAVALIVLILAIGFGFVAFSNNQAASELRTTQAVEDVRRDNALSNTFPPVAPVTPTPAPVVIPQVPNPSATTTNVEVKVPEVQAPAPEAPAAPVEPAPAEPAPADTEIE